MPADEDEDMTDSQKNLVRQNTIYVRGMEMLENPNYADNKLNSPEGHKSSGISNTIMIQKMHDLLVNISEKIECVEKNQELLFKALVCAIN